MSIIHLWKQQIIHNFRPSLLHTPWLTYVSQARLKYQYYSYNQRLIKLLRGHATGHSTYTDSEILDVTKNSTTVCESSNIVMFVPGFMVTCCHVKPLLAVSKVQKASLTIGTSENKSLKSIMNSYFKPIAFATMNRPNIGLRRGNQKLERNASILCKFQPLVTKLQRPWVLPATSLLQHWNSSTIKFWTVCTCAFLCDQTYNGYCKYTTRHNRTVSTNTCANHAFMWSFSPG